MSDRIREFFATFERLNAADEVDEQVKLYADPFLMADPNGSRVVTVGELAAAIPKRKQLFKGIGSIGTRLVTLAETPLDDHYTMVKTTWRWEFDRPVQPDIVVPSTYIVRTSGDTMKIVLYLNHGDIMSIFRERGLLPQPAV